MKTGASTNWSSWTTESSIGTPQIILARFRIHTFRRMSHTCVVSAKINPTAWGPAMWCFLHTLVYQVDLPRFKGLLPVFLRAIPCELCRTHALDYVQANPLPELTSRIQAITYIDKFHNAVNRRLRKAEYTSRNSALKHKNANLTYRALDISRRLKRALPKRCTQPSEVELASPDAAQRMRNIIECLAYIDVLVSSSLRD